MTTAGRELKQIDVRISFRIINLFSGQLYQSPAKAIEELVANSYDAFANECHIIIPDKLSKSDRIVIFDDGSSMDVDGFEKLWTIASSDKREKESKKRLPIGRFGIGKLATYVLANKLTYLCKKDGKIRAVTMDYKRLDPTSVKEEQVLLKVRELTRQEAEDALELPEFTQTGVKLSLFGPRSSKSWTVVVLSELKDKAEDLRLGRLRWVISSALPNIPNFKVFLNGKRVVPTKEEVPIMKRWILGENDEVAKDLGLAAEKVNRQDHQREVEIPDLGPIWGFSELYEDFLTEGVSVKFGRSHGVFVMIRGRLINQDDPNFGIPPLSHSTFNRFRMVVNADGLDNFIVASREGVVSNSATDKLREYIRAKFNEVRNYFTAHLKKTEFEARLSTKIGSLPSSLIGRPLRNLVEQTLTSEKPSALIRVPPITAVLARELLTKEIEETRTIQKSLLRDVKPRSLGSESPLAIFEAVEGLVYLNTDHPFFLNYSETLGSSEPMDVIALAEVLTEAYLRDKGVSPDVAKEIIELRDALLREIVSVRPSSAVAIAKRLRDAGSDKKILEVASGNAFKALGFEVTPIGGSGKPDGVAKAGLGFLAQTGQSGAYSLTYDAKSTSAAKAKTGNLSLATVAQHRNDYHADFGVVVAKEFQTTEEGVDLASRMAKTQSITLLRSFDLANLVEAKAAKLLSLQKIRELFEKCKTPEESKAWIDKVISTPTTPAPVVDLVYAIYELQADGRDNVDLGDVKQYKGKTRRYDFSKYDKNQLSSWCSGLHSLVPQLVIYNEATKSAEVHSSPDNIFSAIASTIIEMPEKIAKAMKEALPPGVVEAERRKQKRQDQEQATRRKRRR